MYKKRTGNIQEIIILKTPTLPLVVGSLTVENRSKYIPT